MKQSEAGHIPAACRTHRLPTIPEDQAVNHVGQPLGPLKVRYVRFMAKEQDKQFRFYKNTKCRRNLYGKLRIDENTTYSYLFSQLQKRTWDKRFTREERCDLAHFTATMSLYYYGMPIETTADTWDLARKRLIDGTARLIFTYKPIIDEKWSVENIGKTVNRLAQALKAKGWAVMEERAVTTEANRGRNERTLPIAQLNQTRMEAAPQREDQGRYGGLSIAQLNQTSEKAAPFLRRYGGLSIAQLNQTAKEAAPSREAQRRYAGLSIAQLNQTGGEETMSEADQGRAPVQLSIAQLNQTARRMAPSLRRYGGLSIAQLNQTRDAAATKGNQGRNDRPVLLTIGQLNQVAS